MELFPLITLADSFHLEETLSFGMMYAKELNPAHHRGGDCSKNYHALCKCWEEVVKTLSSGTLQLLLKPPTSCEEFSYGPDQ